MSKWAEIGWIVDESMMLDGKRYRLILNRHRLKLKNPHYHIFSFSLQCGALWLKQNRKGEIFLSGYITAGRRRSIVVFKKPGAWKVFEPDSANSQPPMERIERINWPVILNVPATAALDEIKSAFRKLALRHHPDHGGEHETFIKIRAAYKQAIKEAV